MQLCSHFSSIREFPTPAVRFLKIAMPPSEQWKLTRKAETSLKQYVEAREQMKRAETKYEALQERVRMKRREAIAAKDTLMEKHPEAELPDAFLDDHETSSDSDWRWLKHCLLLASVEFLKRCSGLEFPGVAEQIAECVVRWHAVLYVAI